MVTNLSAAPSWTLGYTLLWGAWIAVGSLIALFKYPSLIVMAGTSFLGAIGIIVLGVAVYQGSRLAAWTLATIAMIDIGTRLFHGRGGVIMPGLMLAFAVTAVLALRREEYAASDT